MFENSPTPKTLDGAHARHPRTFGGYLYTYPVLSRRSRGVSIGVNLNPDKRCNFDCPYCQVDRTLPGPQLIPDAEVVAAEVGRMLKNFDTDGVCRLPVFRELDDAHKRLRDVALSGDGEPTSAAGFEEICTGLRGVQRDSALPFSLVLITNATLLDKPAVQRGIVGLLEERGAVWAKLDAGSEEWYQKVNVTKIPLDRIESNLLSAGRRFPLSIQTLFYEHKGVLPQSGELTLYTRRLQRLLAGGARLDEVQLYTIARRTAREWCLPAPRKWLEETGRRLREALGVRVTVYH